MTVGEKWERNQSNLWGKRGEYNHCNLKLQMLQIAMQECMDRGKRKIARVEEGHHSKNTKTMQNHVIEASNCNAGMHRQRKKKIARVEEGIIKKKNENCNLKLQIAMQERIDRGKRKMSGGWHHSKKTKTIAT